ncbi:MAG: ABC transporter ATP-binding protein [Armatimonadetes bacterium]|nr:ABC transporter ATP-binding protein [Armatimonadota bacterium]
MGEYLLEVVRLNAFYGTSHVLQDVSLAAGHECVAVVGRNGMGKTTLLRSILRMTPPASHGLITFRGRRIDGLHSHQAASLGIGYVPQGRRLFPSLSVDEHLRLTFRKGADGTAWTPDAVYDLFPEIARRRKLPGTRLSGGEQQMLAIGRALVTNPALLLLDEPSEGLAPLVVQHLIATLRRLREMGTALLLVEQQQRIADVLADRVYVLTAGRIVHHATGKEFAVDTEARRQHLGI